LYDGRYLGNGTILATCRYGFDRGGFGGQSMKAKKMVIQPA
jgi:hypothetical protein